MWEGTLEDTWVASFMHQNQIIHSIGHVIFQTFVPFSLLNTLNMKLHFGGEAKLRCQNQPFYLPCYLFSTSTQNRICAYFCYYNLAKRTWPTLLAFRQPNFTSLLSMRYSWNVFPSVRHMERKTMDNADTTEVILNLLSQNRHLSGTYE